MKAWAARDKEGDLAFFSEPPTRGPALKPYMWEGDGDSMEWLLVPDPLPDLKWEDDPVEIEIEVKRRPGT